MSVFTSAIGHLAGVDTWHFISYDQLSRDLLPEAEGIGLIFIETSWKAKQASISQTEVGITTFKSKAFRPRNARCRLSG